VITLGENLPLSSELNNNPSEKRRRITPYLIRIERQSLWKKEENHPVSHQELNDNPSGEKRRIFSSELRRRVILPEEERRLSPSSTKPESFPAKK